ncbi:MAG: collagen-like protein [Lewinellaceae bacterium]|nr:collagen-like protein [Lewinellaceae bacterium]
MTYKQMILCTVAFILVLFVTNCGYTQVRVFTNENVGIGTDSVESSAKLEIHSETKGILIPRVSSTSMVPNPVDGLLVYVMSMDPDERGFHYWDGGLSDWVRLNYVPGQSTIGVDNTDNIVLDLDNNVLSGDLTTTGVLADTYLNATITVDEFGRIVSASSGVPSGVQGALNSAYTHASGPLQIPALSEVTIGSVTITPTDSLSTILILARNGFQNGQSGNPKTMQTSINRNGTTQVGEVATLYLTQGGQAGTLDHIGEDNEHNSLNPVTYNLVVRNMSTSSQVSAIDWEIEAIELIGPQGPVGLSGPQGPQGPAGPQGPEGEVGPVAFMVGCNDVSITGNGTNQDPYCISFSYQDNDDDSTNEIQILGTNGSPGNVNISDPQNGGVKNEVNININDGDYDPTNELQLLQWDSANLQLSLFPNGNVVTLDGVGTDPTHLSFSGVPPSVGLNSSTGDDVTIQAGNDIDLDLNGSVLTINNSYEDPDDDNENELQYLYTNGCPGNVQILKPDGSYYNHVNINIGDDSDQNEIQHLTLQGNVLGLTLTADAITLPDGITNLSVDGSSSPIIQSSTAEPGMHVQFHAGSGIELMANPHDITISSNGSSIDPGTVVNSVMRWNGTDWVEETEALIDEDGRSAFQNAPLSTEYSITTTDDLLVDSITVGAGRGANITSAVLGYQALNSTDTSSVGNIAIGYKALKSVGYGDHNVAMGYNSQRLHSNGQGNISIGSWSLENLIGNSDNVGVGRHTLQYLVNGYDNAAFGAGALWNCQSNDNVGVGCRALADLNAAGQDFNTAIGYKAADSVSSVQYVTALGAYAGYNYASNYSIYIGQDAGNDVAMEANGDSILIIQTGGDPSALISGDFKTNHVGIDLEPKDASRTLDVNGELRIRDLETTPPDKLIGADIDGVVSKVILGNNLVLSSDTLHASGGLKFGDIQPVVLAGLNMESDTVTDIKVNYYEPASQMYQVSNVRLQNDTLYGLRGSYFETYKATKWAKALSPLSGDTLDIDESGYLASFDFSNDNGTLTFHAPDQYTDSLPVYLWNHIFQVNVTLSIRTQFIADAVIGIRRDGVSSNLHPNWQTEFSTAGSNRKMNISLSCLVPLHNGSTIAVELIDDNPGGEDDIVYVIERVNFNAHHIKSSFVPQR